LKHLSQQVETARGKEQKPLQNSTWLLLMWLCRRKLCQIKNHKICIT